MKPWYSYRKWDKLADSDHAHHPDRDHANICDYCDAQYDVEVCGHYFCNYHYDVWCDWAHARIEEQLEPDIDD